MNICVQGVLMHKVATNKVLEVNNVSKIIKGKKIVSDFSFFMEEGEIVGLVGPNGAGKTTLMRMIVGLIAMNSGSIYINNLSTSSNHQECLKRIGAVIETPTFYPYLTGKDNLNLLGSMSGIFSDDDINRVIQLVQLEAGINKKVGTYSMGMKQRLGVAQALLHRPKLIILDEPTNGLDPVGVMDLRLYLKSIAENQKVAILISSHILSELELICNKVILIKDGCKVGDEKYGLQNKVASDYIIEYEADKNIKTVLSDYKVIDVTDTEIRLQITKAEIPLCIAKLVESGISIYSVQKVVVSLEGVYLDTFGIERKSDYVD